jgi:hypothetical protein
MTPGAPIHWNVCFCRTGFHPWLDRLLPGEFKHVRAFGYVPLEDTWIFVDSNLAGVTVRAARAGSAVLNSLIAAWIADCEVILMPQREYRRLLPGLYCVGLIKRLIGSPSGALLPSGLYRHCLANGGKEFDEKRAPRANAAADPARSGA